MGLQIYDPLLAKKVSNTWGEKHHEFYEWDEYNEKFLKVLFVKFVEFVPIRDFNI